MRTIETIVSDIINQLQQLSSVSIDQDHDLYKAFITLFTHQSDFANVLISVGPDYMYNGWIHYIADKYLWNFWVQSGTIPQSGVKLKDRMKEYIVMNQLQNLGGAAIHNEHIMDICLTFQLYSMRDVFTGYAASVSTLDRNYIFEICRSAISKYASFIQDITINTTSIKGKLVVKS